MGLGIKAFLRESWELFYWSLFLPSKLQGRMNVWGPRPLEDGKQPDTGFWDILVPGNGFNGRFLSQHCFFILLLSLPLLSFTWIQTGVINWWQLSIFPVSYSIAVLFLPASWLVPLSWLLVTLDRPGFFQAEIIARLPQAFAEVNLPPVSQMLLGLGILGGGTGITSGAVYDRLERTQPRLARIIGTVGLGLSGAIAGYVASANIAFAGLIVGLAAFLWFIATNDLDERSDPDQAGVVAVVVAVGVAGVVAGVVAVGVAVGVAGVATAAPWVGMTLALTVGLVYSSRSINWRILGVLALVCALLTVEQSPFLAGATAIMVVLGYYRIVPDYALESIIIGRAALPSLAFWSKRPKDHIPALKSLAPFNSEFAFFPLPGHSTLIAQSFQTAPIETLPLFKAIQAAEATGLKATVRDVLPQIISDRLKAQRHLHDFLGAVQNGSPHAGMDTVPALLLNPDVVLPAIAPSLFDEDNPGANLADEIRIPFLKLQSSAQTLIAALTNRNATLLERRFESVLGDLERFKTSLPSRGLNPKAVQRWQPVIEHFQRLIDLELIEIRKVAQGEIINPFAFGNPLKPATMDVFRGRTKISDSLMRLILDRNRPTLVLHGPRRFGKTSFLLNIPRLLPGQLVPIYLNLQDRSTISSEANFCNSFVRAFIKDGRSQNIKFPPEPSRKDFLQDPFWTLRDWLDKALETTTLELDDRWILVTLDEAEKLGEAIEAGKLTTAIFDQLRDFIQHRDRLAFLFSGVQTPNELGPNWSNYFISTVPIEIGYLESEEAEDLLRNPISDFNFTYADGIVEEILRLTCCQPYLVQLMGWTLVNTANEQQVKHGDRQLLNDALPEALTNGEPYFDNLWQDFVAPKTHLQLREAARDFLFDLADGDRPQTPEPDLQPAIRHMVRYKVIEQFEDGTCQIQVPLVALWIRDRAP